MKYLLFFLLISNCCYSQTITKRVAICQDNKGCEEATVRLTPEKINQLLAKPGLLNAADSASILVLDQCEAYLEDSLTMQQLHLRFGGNAKFIKRQVFDLEKYIKEKGCLRCPNTTKKISFRVTSPEFSGSGYFYANLQNGEAYMPNAAHHQLYGPEAAGMTVDAFFRNYQYVSYIIDPEGKKWKVDMPIGTSLGPPGKGDAINEKIFKTQFRATGQKRKPLQTSLEQIEYTGQTDEGKLTFWLAPALGVCLPPGKFDAWGFFNLGYIAVDGVTYLVAEISAAGFTAQVTGLEEGNYQFNTSGYSSINMGQ